jgi:hypothetical protein
VFVHYGKNKVGGQETLREVEKFSSGRLCQADLMDPGECSASFNWRYRSDDDELSG